MKIEIEVPDKWGEKIISTNPAQRLEMFMFLSQLKQFLENNDNQEINFPNLANFSDAEKLILLELIELWFVPLSKPLPKIMQEISQEAQKNGLTPEILTDILNED